MPQQKDLCFLGVLSRSAQRRLSSHEKITMELTLSSLDEHQRFRLYKAKELSGCSTSKQPVVEKASHNELRCPNSLHFLEKASHNELRCPNSLHFLEKASHNELRCPNSLDFLEKASQNELRCPNSLDFLEKACHNELRCPNSLDFLEKASHNELRCPNSVIFLALSNKWLRKTDADRRAKISKLYNPPTHTYANTHTF